MSTIVVADSHTIFRTVLINSAAVTALVPAVRIFQPWYPSTATFPLITFNEVNNYNDDTDYFDDQASSDHLEIETHIFTPPNTSTYAIFAAMDTALKAAGWTRDFSSSLPDPGQYGHRVMRYSKRTAPTFS